MSTSVDATMIVRSISESENRVRLTRARVLPEMMTRQASQAGWRPENWRIPPHAMQKPVIWKIFPIVYPAGLAKTSVAQRIRAPRPDIRLAVAHRRTPGSLGNRRSTPSHAPDWKTRSTVMKISVVQVSTIGIMALAVAPASRNGMRLMIRTCTHGTAGLSGSADYYPAFPNNGPVRQAQELLIAGQHLRHEAVLRNNSHGTQLRSFCSIKGLHHIDYNFASWVTKLKMQVANFSFPLWKDVVRKK